VKELWKQGKAPTVAWLDTADTYIAEIMANVGFDVLLLDSNTVWLLVLTGQRSGSRPSVQQILCLWFVYRGMNRSFIQWVLDAGAYGVVVPLVNSREEAAKAGGACRYPPVGYRSAGANRLAYMAESTTLSKPIRKSSAWSRSKTSTLWHTWTTWRMRPA